MTYLLSPSVVRVCLFTVFVVVCFGCDGAAKRQNHLAITVSESTLEIALGGKRTVEVTVTNTSSRPVKLDRIKSSCACTVLSQADGIEVPPYQSITLPAEVTATRLGKGSVNFYAIRGGRSLADISIGYDCVMPLEDTKLISTSNSIELPVRSCYGNLIEKIDIYDTYTGLLLASAENIQTGSTKLILNETSMRPGEDSRIDIVCFTPS